MKIFIFKSFLLRILRWRDSSSPLIERIWWNFFGLTHVVIKDVICWHGSCTPLVGNSEENVKTMIRKFEISKSLVKQKAFCIALLVAFTMVY